MDDKQDATLSIGQFATASQLSLKALRLYHQEDLLPPAYVDPFTNYRYYATYQLRTARLIRLMRQMEMPLSEVKEVLKAADSDPQEVSDIIQRYLQSFKGRLEAAQRVAQNLKVIIERQEEVMPFEVSVNQFKPQRVTCIEARVKVDRLNAFIQRSLETLQTYVEGQGATLVGSPVGIYHGQINQEEDGPIQVCWEVEGDIQPSDDIRVEELPGGSFASAEAIGPDCDFPAILEAYDSVCQWIANQGYQMIGSPREIWHSLQEPEGHIQVAWQFKE
jgi:DNA-binding transcriptional MerR regulator